VAASTSASCTAPTQESVRGHLRPDLQPIATFACLPGWRTASEVLPLEWRQMDLQAGIVRLEPGATKNN
jgi:hypothetical protein